MNVLTYDYHTAYDPETDHHSPLTSRPGTSKFDDAAKLNVDWTVKYYIEQGAPANKIIVGVPTYGRSFTLLDGGRTGISAPADGPGDAGPGTREKGYLAYYEICQKIEEEKWVVKNEHPESHGPYAYHDKQWVAYDDAEIIKEKAKFILSNNLGGAMVWTLDNDDFRGLCHGQQSPLITALKTALLTTQVETEAPPTLNAIASRPVSNSRRPTDLINLSNQPRNRLVAATEPPAPLLSGIRRYNTARRTTSTTTTTTTTQAPTTQPPTTTTLKDFVTPEPPTTPDPGVPFECQDEGFFKNPKDCKKYFWCLDSGPANLGIVAHAFTCPSGLYFNTKTEACDYPENVSCKVKSSKESSSNPKRNRPTTTSTTTTTTTTTTTPAPETTSLPNIPG